MVTVWKIKGQMRMEAIMETGKAAEVQVPGGNSQDQAVDMKQAGRQSEV